VRLPQGVPAISLDPFSVEAKQMKNSSDKWKYPKGIENDLDDQRYALIVPATASQPFGGKPREDIDHTYMVSQYLDTHMVSFIKGMCLGAWIKH